MNRNQRRSRIVFVLLGSGLVATIAAAPASAALTDGAFFVHAQNSEDPSIQALAGRGGSAGNPGSGGDGGSNPGDGGESAGAVTFKGGPLSITVTEDMLAFSEANRKAQEEGRLGDIKTDPDGWQTIWSYDAGSQTLVPGIVGATDDLALTVFSKKSVAPSVSDAAGRSSDDIIYQFFREGRQSDYSISDYRVKPQNGAVFYYRTYGSYSADDPSRNYYGETRYISEDGGLVAVTVAKQADGRLTIQRSTDPRVFTSYSKSSSRPYSLAFDSGKPSDMTILLPNSNAGYNQIQIQTVDGGFQVHYRNYLGQADGQDNYGASRTNGPGSLQVDNTGKIVSLSYTKQNGETGYLNNSPTVADYNSASGQNWDGSYAKFSDFDLSFPFQATKP